MSNSLKWSKFKKNNINDAEKLLRENEKYYVSACSRFLSGDTARDSAWILNSKTEGLKALLINSKSILMPVFPGQNEIPSPDFLGSILGKKNIHSIQGLTTEVKIIEEVLNKKGMKVKDIIDYDLMSLDVLPKIKPVKICPVNLELCVPQFKDVEALAPLQAGYEKEEVIPKGSDFNPVSSRLNIAKIVKNGIILAAKLNEKFVGKININAVSFTRYQVGGVYVLPEFRGQGIAGKMAWEFINSLINQGRGVTLFVKKANIPALKLYKSLGFTSCNNYRITYY